MKHGYKHELCYKPCRYQLGFLFAISSFAEVAVFAADASVVVPKVVVDADDAGDEDADDHDAADDNGDGGKGDDDKDDDDDDVVPNKGGRESNERIRSSASNTELILPEST